MEILYRTLEVINYIVIGICTLMFLFQFVMILFFWLPEKHFKKSEEKHRAAIVICARNESSVIAETIRLFKEEQDYPADKLDIYVVADNCTDNTAELAEQAGAKVIVHNDPDPSHHRASYAIEYGLRKILESGEKYDFFIRFDADNHANPGYVSYMNDAYCSGVEIARPFENSTNPGQNAWASVSAGYYVRDSKIACNFRENFHLDSMLTGAGMMVSGKIVEEIGGWDAMGVSDDSEFTLNRLLENKRVHYVADAIVYEDQPSTFKDTWNRITRLGKGIHTLFWQKGFRLLGHFFKSGKWSNVDLFVQLLAIPVAVLVFCWFVPYYIFYIIVNLLNAVGPVAGWMADVHTIQGVALTAEVSAANFLGDYGLIKMIVIVLGTYIVIYPLQTWLAIITSKKKMGLKSLKGWYKGIFASPLFMIFYSFAIFVGVFSKPKWKAVSRNPKTN